MKKSKISCDLKCCSMCNRCLKDWLPAIDANRKNFLFKKGETLFREGDQVTGIYFVYSGAVKVHKHWGPDKELIVRFAKNGDIVGHRGLGHNAVYPVSATTLEETITCFLDIDFFNSTLRVNPEFLFHLMMFFADELQESERKMRNLAHMPVKGRVAQALITLSEKFGHDENGFLDLTLSRQDLASYTGTTYETVFRIMNEFIQDKAVDLSGKNIAITNKDQLLSYIQQSF